MVAQPVAEPYVSLGAGADFLQDAIVKPTNSAIGPSRRDYTFDPGAAVAASLGYGLGNGIRLEVEGDYANNHVRGVHAAEPERAGAHEQQFGGFFYALYDFDLGLPVTPYAGLGAGYQQIELDGINSSARGATTSGGKAEDKGDFAYQAIAG